MVGVLFLTHVFSVSAALHHQVGFAEKGVGVASSNPNPFFGSGEHISPITIMYQPATVVLFYIPHTSLEFY